MRLHSELSRGDLAIHLSISPLQEAFVFAALECCKAEPK